MRYLIILLLLVIVFTPFFPKTLEGIEEGFKTSSPRDGPPGKIQLSRTQVETKVKKKVMCLQKSSPGTLATDIVLSERESKVDGLVLCCCQISGGEKCCGHVVRCGGPIPGCWCK